MAKVTQDYSDRLMAKKSYNFRYLLVLFILGLVLYTPEILNINIEQEDRNMPRERTPQEIEFLEYFRRIETFEF